MKKPVLSFLFLVFLLLASGTQAQEKPLKVVASFSILADIVREVGGEAVSVEALVGAGEDAHTYQPTAQDVKRLAKADVVVLNGLGFEGWMERLIASSGTKAMRVTASEKVKPREVEEEEHHHGHHHGHHHDEENVDPHAWQDLSNGVLYAQTIGAALQKARPAQAEAIQKRTNAYVALMQKLDAEIKKAFAAIPASERKVISSHDAFGYFEAAYGVTFLAPQGVSTEAEASAKNVAVLTDQIKKEGIKAIFVEHLGDPRLVEQMARDTGVTMGGELYSDALSDEKGPASTYLKLFYANAHRLISAMGGKGFEER